MLLELPAERIGRKGCAAPPVSIQHFPLGVEDLVEPATHEHDPIAVIVRQLTQQANQDYYQASLEAQKRELHLKVDTMAVNAVVNAKKSAVEMFRDAGEVPGADERIAAYRAVVESYPESEYAPQALFMVGFVESEEKRAYDQAEGAFKELLAKYPKSELISSAQWMLDNMRSDKTPNFDLPGDLGKASEHDSPTRTPETGKAAPPATGPTSKP